MDLTSDEDAGTAAQKTPVMPVQAESGGAGVGAGNETSIAAAAAALNPLRKDRAGKKQQERGLCCCFHASLTPSQFSASLCLLIVWRQAKKMLSDLACLRRGLVDHIWNSMIVRYSQLLIRFNVSLVLFARLTFRSRRFTNDKDTKSGSRSRSVVLSSLLSRIIVCVPEFCLFFAFFPEPEHSLLMLQAIRMTRAIHRPHVWSATASMTKSC